MKKFRAVFILIGLVFLSKAWADPPKDFQVIYYSSAGPLEKATIEKITVKKGAAVMERDAVQVGGGGEKTKDSKSYKVSPAQFDELYQIVQGSAYLTWPSGPDADHASQVEEYFEVSSEGKTVRRTRWEAGNQERFRKFYEDFNRWYTQIRSVMF